MAWAETTRTDEEPEGLAFASLPFQPALRAFFGRRAEAHEIDDLIQEVLLRMHNRRSTVEVANLPSFIFQTATNVLLDRRRRETVRRSSAHCELKEIQHPRDDLSPERILQAKQEASVAVEALKELSPRTRAAFVLIRFEGLSYKAAATRLGISVSAVEKHVTKALRLVSTRLQETDERRSPIRRTFR